MLLLTIKSPFSTTWWKFLRPTGPARVWTAYRARCGAHQPGLPERLREMLSKIKQLRWEERREPSRLKKRTPYCYGVAQIGRLLIKFHIQQDSQAFTANEYIQKIGFAPFTAGMPVLRFSWMSVLGRANQRPVRRVFEIWFPRGGCSDCQP